MKLSPKWTLILLNLYYTLLGLNSMYNEMSALHDLAIGGWLCRPRMKAVQGDRQPSLARCLIIQLDLEKPASLSNPFPSSLYNRFF